MDRAPAESSQSLWFFDGCGSTGAECWRGGRFSGTPAKPRHGCLRRQAAQAVRRHAREVCARVARGLQGCPPVVPRGGRQRRGLPGRARRLHALVRGTEPPMGEEDCHRLMGSNRKRFTTRPMPRSNAGMEPPLERSRCRACRCPPLLPLMAAAVEVATTVLPRPPPPPPLARRPPPA